MSDPPAGEPPAPPPPARRGGFPLLELLRGAPATQALIVANVAVSAGMTLSGGDEFDWGALAIVDGSVPGGLWRFLSAGFVHFGLAHLLLNLLGLTIFGSQLERRYRSPLRYLALFLFCVLLGNVVTWRVSFGDRVLAGGASGGVFGLITASAVALMWEKRLGEVWSLLVFAVLNIAAGAANPHVGTAAHLGGAFAGFWAGNSIEHWRADRADRIRAFPPPLHERPVVDPPPPPVSERDTPGNPRGNGNPPQGHPSDGE